MAYIYLLELHETIRNRSQEAEARRRQADTAGASDEAAFQQGRLAALEGLDHFLHQGYNHLLPRRLRAQPRP
ncbi:MAG: hypothetical protein AB1634_12145 [Thermodesulfobacteriota bacterium]